MLNTQEKQKQKQKNKSNSLNWKKRSNSSRNHMLLSIFGNTQKLSKYLFNYFFPSLFYDPIDQWLGGFYKCLLVASGFSNSQYFSSHSRINSITQQKGYYHNKNKNVSLSTEIITSQLPLFLNETWRSENVTSLMSIFSF